MSTNCAALDLNCSPLELVNKIEDISDAYVQNTNVIEANSGELGLDTRACYSLFLHEDGDWIALTNSRRRSMDYYGGFEYVDPNCIVQFGNYTFYLNDCSRVQDAIDCYFNG